MGPLRRTSYLARFAPGGRLTAFVQTHITAVNRLMGVDYRHGDLREMLSDRPGLRSVFGSPGDVANRFAELARSPDLIGALAVEGREITEAHGSAVSAVDSREGGHFDRLDIAATRLTPQAQAFFREPTNHLVMSATYLRHGFPLRSGDADGGFRLRTSDGEVEVRTGPEFATWSDATGEGSISLGMSTVDISDPLRSQAPDGTVAISRLATTQLRHNLAGARLQISWLTPDGRLGGTAPGYGRHPLGLVDAVNPTLGYMTFAPATLRFAAALEVLATWGPIDERTITSPEFRAAVNQRAYADHPWLHWVELGLATADRVGLVAQAWQVAAGRRTPPPLDLGTPDGGDQPLENPDTAAVEAYTRAVTDTSAEELAALAIPSAAEVVQRLSADLSTDPPDSLLVDLPAGLPTESRDFLDSELSGGGGNDAIADQAAQAEKLARPAAHQDPATGAAGGERQGTEEEETKTADPRPPETDVL